MRLAMAAASSSLTVMLLQTSGPLRVAVLSVMLMLLELMKSWTVGERRSTFLTTTETAALFALLKVG